MKARGRRPSAFIVFSGFEPEGKFINKPFMVFEPMC